MLELIAGGQPNDNYDDTIKIWTVRRGIAGLVSSFRAIEDDLYSLVNEGCHLHPTPDERTESKANNISCSVIDKPTIDMNALRKELIDESREIEKKAAAVCNMLSLCGVAQYPDELSQCDLSQVFDCLHALVTDVYDVASNHTLHIDIAFDTIQGRAA
ncbi:MAG: hypothetical protein NC184_04045 [Roseburia sp.]|nr:hypothetical protein [Roseburia sp.]